jgi:hypothetical protein
MINSYRVKIIFSYILFFLIGPIGCATNLPTISISRVPDNGILPIMQNDSKGDTHLIYFKLNEGDNSYEEGNIFYRYYIDKDQQWSDAIQVSTNSFEHLGAVEKPTFTVSGDGRIHVTWFNTETYTYMYTRSNQVRDTFEEERVVFNVDPEGIETSASISSHDNHVSLVWHAGSLMQEEARSVYALTSRDNGASFLPEVQLSDSDLGACACCGLTTGHNLDGELIVAYRSAINRRGRHMQLITTDNIYEYAENHVKARINLISEWFLEACPVSTNYIANNYWKKGNDTHSWLAFETSGEIYQYELDSENSEATLVKAAKTKTRQKHPALAISDSGEKLIVWGEAYGFTKGGTLNMQLFDPGNNPLPTEEPVELAIPDNSIAAVAVTNSKSFLVLY